MQLQAVTTATDMALSNSERGQLFMNNLFLNEPAWVVSLLSTAADLRQSLLSDDDDVIRLKRARNSTKRIKRPDSAWYRQLACCTLALYLAHSLTHLPVPLTHSLTHPLTHSSTHSFTHPLAHPLTHTPLTHSSTHSLIHQLTHSLHLAGIYSMTYLLNKLKISSDNMVNMVYTS